MGLILMSKSYLMPAVRLGDSDNRYLNPGKLQCSRILNTPRWWRTSRWKPKIISFMTIIARGAWVRSLRGQNQRELKEGREIQNKIIWVQAEGLATQVVINKGSEKFYYAECDQPASLRWCWKHQSVVTALLLSSVSGTLIVQSVVEGCSVRNFESCMQANDDFSTNPASWCGLQVQYVTHHL